MLSAYTHHAYQCAHQRLCVARVYVFAGVNFQKMYGYDVAHLPHPGTFVISGKTGKLVYADVTRDYRTRIEPQVLIDVIKKL